MHHLVSFMWTCDYVKLYFVAINFTLLKNKRMTITTVNLRIEYCCTLGYRPKTHLKLKSCEISFVHIIPNLLKFCTVHGIDTTVVCIKLQNDSNNHKISYRQARFRKIWAYAEFRRGILCCNSPQGPLLLTCKSNYIYYNMCGEITYPFPCFNGCTVEVWEWIGNFIPHFNVHVITYPCWD